MAKAVHKKPAKKNKKIWQKKFFKKIILSSLVILAIVVGSLSAYILAYRGKIYPNIYIAGIPVGGFDKNNFDTRIPAKFFTPESLQIRSNNKTFELKLKDINFYYDFDDSYLQAFSFGRTDGILKDFILRLSLLLTNKNLHLQYSLDEQKLTKSISQISDSIYSKPISPSAKLADGKIIVSKGSAGTELDKDVLNSNIARAFSTGNFEPIELPIIATGTELSDDEAETFKSRAEKYIGKSIQIKFEFNTFNLSDKEIVQMLDLKNGLNNEAITKYINEIAKQTERDFQNPKFDFADGKVIEFQPALDGIKVDREKFLDLLISSINNFDGSDDKSAAFDIPVIRTPPEITTGSVNNLGIRELIGRGTSTFYHSIASRIHNLTLAASKINGVLVKPGEAFSFNKVLGDVSADTGYQQAYIISEGKTILGDGGGVCQVSTTLFRSVLNAGLPVPERQAHAYRVGYYEQNSAPGFDATVYDPSPDFKFVNTTPAHILIKASVNRKNYSLVIELYGTNDGRVSSVSKPVVSEITAPPPDLYQDDPTIPIGTIKQIDYKAWGAKVIFNYLVTRNGQEIYKKTFISNYRPWQAVYLRGTKAL